MNIFEKVTAGLMIADVVAVIGSFDIILPEIDR
jgi:NADH:ubiquinone oxidoreductase subunit D